MSLNIAPDDAAGYADDILDAFTGIDNDYLDDLDAHISVGVNQSPDATSLVGQLHYQNGVTVDFELSIKLTGVST